MLGLSNEREIYFDALNTEKKKSTTYVTEDMPVAKSKGYKEYSKEIQPTGER